MIHLGTDDMFPLKQMSTSSLDRHSHLKLTGTWGRSDSNVASKLIADSLKAYRCATNAASDLGQNLPHHPTGYEVFLAYRDQKGGSSMSRYLAQAAEEDPFYLEARVNSRVVRLARLIRYASELQSQIVDDAEH